MVLGLYAGQGTNSVCDNPANVLLITSSSRIPAYQEALEGLRDTLARAGVTVTEVTVDHEAGNKRLAALLLQRPAAVVTLGSAAAAAAASIDHGAPVAATMVLAPPKGASESRNIKATIAVDVSPGDVLERLKQLYPDRRRVALIRGPALSSARAAAIAEQGLKQGYNIQVVDCSGPKELLGTFGSLRERFDFVWLLPDSNLYHSATVSALVMASIRYRLPLIGFSEGLVQAGALAGFWADYRDIGAQTGEAVLRIMKGRAEAPVAYPRKINAAINERVSRALGLPAPMAGKGLSILP
jgi:putative ABC transport system substrate-binding protein